MTRFTVAWVQSAVDELIDIWLAMDDRNAVTAATNATDHELQTDAQSKGIELAEELRALNSPPLRVIFAVRVDDRVAEVLLVRRI